MKNSIQSPASQQIPETILWNNIQAAIGHITPSDLFNHDKDQLNKTFYGHHLFNFPRETIVLDVQADSGLLAFRFACWNQRKTPVYIINSSIIRRDALSRIAAENGLHNVHLFPDLTSANELIKEANQNIGLLKIDLAVFNAQLLKQILTEHTVFHVYGSVNDASIAPLELYRLCKRHSQAFYWFNSDRRDIIAGNCSDQIEVSAIVPAYGVEKYLDTCLASLVNQTIESKEIIVVDDGSTDNSGQLADTWQRKYPDLIKVIHKENGGCASARSAGLAVAKGQYVAFIDGDDWIEPPMLEKLYESASLMRSEVAQCGFRYYYEQDNSYLSAYDFAGLTNQNQGRAGVLKKASDMALLQPSIWRRIYRTDYLRENGIDFPHHLKRFDDLYFHFSSLYRATRVSTIPEIYYNYRQQRQGQSIEATDERLYVHFDIFELLKKDIHNNGNYQTEKLLRQVQLGTHRWALSRIDKQYKATYIKKMASDLFENVCYITPIKTLKLAKNAKIFKSVLRAYLYYSNSKATK